MREACKSIDAALHALKSGCHCSPRVAVAPPLRVNVKDIAARDGLRKSRGGAQGGMQSFHASAARSQAEARELEGAPAHVRRT